MGEHVIKLPDVGEGVAEAELVEWHVKVGDLVREDSMLAAVMTDKATVEIPSPVDGEILWLGAEIGDTVAVGSPIVRLKVAGEGNVTAGEAAATGKAGGLQTPTPDTAPQGGGEQPAAAPEHVAKSKAAEAESLRPRGRPRRRPATVPLARPMARLAAKGKSRWPRQLCG
jgi:2-oxoisovalerate dehydrogenase E2 component (dihydrolipoyl transacylase)